MKKAVLHHISSDFGKNSSIGYRSLKIYENIKEDLKITVICRSNKSNVRKNKIWSLYLSYLFSRLLSFIRVYIIYNLPAREYELFIFNLLSLPLIIFHFLINTKNKRYFHSWDTSFWLLFLVKKLNYFIIRDSAMTPSKSSLIKALENPKFYIDKITTNENIKIEKKIFMISEVIISPSEYTSNFIIKEYKINPKKIKTIPFGVNYKHFSDASQKNYPNRKILKFGFVGLVNMRKGVRWLINVLNAINEKENVFFELHLFGRIFNEEIDTINNANFKIIEYGFIEASKENIYKNFDVLIHPSFIEGSAKCIYEGMASGLPIICTNESGSLVRHNENGFIFKAGDSKSLYMSLMFFLKNRNKIKTMGLKSKEIIKNYSWEIYAKKVIKNYLYKI